MYFTPLEKRNSAIRVLDVLFCITQLLVFIGYVSNSYDNETIFSRASQLFILINVATFAIYIIQNAKKVELVLLLILFLMAFSVFIAFAVTGVASVYNFVITLCAYLSLPMYLIYVRKIDVNKLTLFFTITCALSTAVFFIVSFFIHPEYSVNKELTLGFFNPNQTAMFIFQNLSVILVIMTFCRNRFLKFLLFAVIAFESFEVVMTASRIAVICVAFAIVLGLFKNKIKFSGNMVTIFMLLPLIFVFLIEIMYSNHVWENVEILGKPFYSGREEMFSNFFVELLKNPIFGNYARYQLSNSHNAYLAVLLSLGLVGFIVFIVFYFYIINGFRKTIVNPVQKVAFIGILLIFIESTSEAALLVSGSMYAAATSTLIFFINYKVDFDEK